MRGEGRAADYTSTYHLHTAIPRLVATATVTGERTVRHGAVSNSHLPRRPGKVCSPLIVDSICCAGCHLTMEGEEGASQGYGELQSVYLRQHTPQQRGRDGWGWRVVST